MSFTLATLKTAIQDYTDNSESTFVTHLPDFIKASEEKILKSVDLDYFRKNVTSTLTSSDQYVNVPSDYLASFSFQITTSGSESFLLQKDVNFLREYTPAATTTGLPKYYARFDEDTFIEEFLPKVLKDRSTIVVVDKKGDTKGYITEKELAISLSKTSHNEQAKTF